MQDYSAPIEAKNLNSWHEKACEPYVARKFIGWVYGVYTMS